MTFSIDWKPSRNLSMDDCHKSDALHAGMLEQVLENLVSWHDVERKDMDRVVTYIGHEFSGVLAKVYEEHTSGGFCECKPVCAIQL